MVLLKTVLLFVCVSVEKKKNLYHVILGRKSEPLTANNNAWCVLSTATSLEIVVEKKKKKSLVGCSGRMAGLILD